MALVDPQTSTRSLESTDLDRPLVRGIAWTGAARWSTQAVTWAATLVIARILSPSDYGIFSLATLYLGFLSLVTEFGLGSAIVTIRNLTDLEIGQLNTLSVLLGFTGFGLTCVAAIPLARFFHTPPLAAVLAIMALGFVIASLQSVPTALLQRDLDFKYISLVDIAKSVSMTTVMLFLAFMGAGYWTLVFGSLVGAVVACTLTLAKRRHGFALPKRSDLKRAVGFSWQVLVGRISWYGYSNSDFFVAGRVLGDVVLGYYSLAWNLANLPIEKMTTLIGSVTPGIYSAAQNDKEALRRYVLKPVEAIGILIFPVMAGLAVVASDAVPVVLGPKWTSAIVPLQLLSIYACVRSVMPLLAQVLIATGDSRFVMWANISSLAIFPVVFWRASLNSGAVGIAAAWILVYPLNAIPIFLRARNRIQLSSISFFKALWPGLSSTMLMVGSVLLLKLAIPARMPEVLRLLVLIAAGAVVYVSTIFIVHRSRLGMFRTAFGLLRG